MDIKIHHCVAEIAADSWNNLVKGNNPFMRHEFFHGLEETQCVSKAKGWEGAHFAAYQDDKLVGVLPCYVKEHSYGEYIFDWAWASAYHRHGLDYYPKLCNAVPFTPASGPRILAKEAVADLVRQALINTVIEYCQEHALSSFHCLFLDHDQINDYTTYCDIRRSSQFHWHNRDYSCFEEFLANLSSKKRKNIKRERRRVQEMQVKYKWLSKEQLTSESADTMHHFYLRTISMYGAQAYLNKEFFHYLVSEFSDQVLFLFAFYENQAIAGGLYFKSDNTLYGRYWGSLANFHSLHFETCYYQAIEWSIKNAMKHFEAGAQGEHKLARGLEPTNTWSAHWISHEGFRGAVANFLDQEQQHIEEYQAYMQAKSPFKTEL